MALIIIEDYKLGIGGSQEEGLAFRINDHDIPGLENSTIMFVLGPESAEGVYNQIGEALGKTSKIHVAGANEMPKEANNGGQ